MLYKRSDLFVMYSAGRRRLLPRDDRDSRAVHACVSHGSRARPTGDIPSFILLCYRQNAGFVHKSVDVGTKYVHENVANKVKFVHKSVDASCGVR